MVKTLESSCLVFLDESKESSCKCDAINCKIVQTSSDYKDDSGDTVGDRVSEGTPRI